MGQSLFRYIKAKWEQRKIEKEYINTFFTDDTPTEANNGNYCLLPNTNRSCNICF